MREECERGAGRGEMGVRMSGDGEWWWGGVRGRGEKGERGSVRCV